MSNEELISFLRETGKEELLSELAFERAALEFCYTRQRRQLGLGHAVLCARPFVGKQSFVVALGDSIIGINAQSRIVHRMVEAFAQQSADAVIAFEEVPRHEVKQYGIAKPKGNSCRRLHPWPTSSKSRSKRKHPAIWLLLLAMSSVPPFLGCSIRRSQARAARFSSLMPSVPSSIKVAK